MFGYIKPNAAELRVREYECYRAYYCGLCRAMGSCTGQCSRMTLSYDFVFLAAVRAYLMGEKPTIRRARCIAHPFKKRPTVEPSPQLRYCADASAILSYQKCKDDSLDERGWKKFRAKLAMLFLSSAYKKARTRHPELNRRVYELLEELHDYERHATSPSADEPARIFGELMRAVFSEGLEGQNARLAAEIGYGIGRWIYLVDAADDLEGDRKHHRFNPYLALLGEAPTQKDREMIETALTAILCETERAYLLFDEPPCAELREILSNIFYLGLPEQAKKILFPADCKCKKKDRKGENI